MREIATVVDNKYTIPLCVMLTSLFENNKGYQFNIHVFFYNLNKKNKIAIEKIVKINNSKVTFYKVDISKIKHVLRISDHISETVYLKMFIPKLANVQGRILYLDSDIIVNGPINKIFSTNLDHAVLGAVTDYFMDRIADLGYNAKYGYFNSGLMLIDITRWNNFKTTEKVIDFIKNNQEKLKWWDQDAFNAVLFKKWVHIPAVYNFQSYMFLDKAKFIGNKRPILIHFTSYIKPWSFRCNHPQRGKYWKYLRMTDYRNYKMTDVNFKNLIYHLIPFKTDVALSSFIRKIRKNDQS